MNISTVESTSQSELLPSPTKDSECINSYGIQTTGLIGGSFVRQQQNLPPPIGVNKDVTGYSMCADEIEENGRIEQVK